MHEFITLLDYFLLPFYLVIIYVIAISFRDRHYPIGHPWRAYFIPGLTAKILGALFIGFIYQYYYGGGDTANYFFHADLINKSFGESPVKWFNLVMHIPPWYDGEYAEYISKMFWYDASTEYIVCCITAVLALFTFTTYLPTSVILASITFTGIWALFRTFATKYPAYTRYVAIATLFIPSTIMWGSGIFKDSICMFGMGWLTFGAFRVLINRDLRIQTILMTLVSFYLVSSIKIYILMAFLPALTLWILFTYSHRIKDGLARSLLKIGVIGIAIVGFMFFSTQFASSLGRYSLENVASTSYNTSAFIQYISGDQGSAYSLGDMDPSIGGMLKKFPLAVNVSLFRPYIWETRKPIQLLNAIEASWFLWITIKVFFTLGLGRVWRAISEDPTIQFCLIFAIVFAFAVGISSGNFGTLSRYRIPCLPFYGMAMILIYYKYNPVEKNILSLKFN